MNRLAVACLVLAGLAAAQTNRGSLSGNVLDPSGAVVAGASVTVTNLATNQVNRLTTSHEGVFSLPSLDPVEYKVEAVAAGFQKTVVERIKIDTATAASVTLTLRPAGVETTLQVTADAPLINSESATTSQTVSEREIRDIPMGNRNVLELAMAMPNVSGDVGSEDPTVTAGATVPGFNMSLNGGRPGCIFSIIRGGAQKGPNGAFAGHFP